MKLVQEIVEVTRRRLFVFFQPKQLPDFVVVKLIHFQRRLGNRIFPKLFQIILQLPIRVEEPRPYRAFRNTQDFTDLCVGHSLNMEHGNHSSVLIRQFHHRLVQPFLELGQVRFPHGAARLSQFQELFVVLNAGIDIVEAEIESAAALLEEVQCHVHRDRVDPSVER